MIHTHDLLRDRLLTRAGLFEPPRPKYRLADLIVSEWSTEFEMAMRNRMLMGALRYGLLADKKKRGHQWDLVGAIQRKIEMYEATGNTEYLVDAANYCLLEFECGVHPNKHFHALDDHTDHCQRIWKHI